MVNERSALHDLIRRGRRRQAAHWLIHTVSFGFGAAMAGAILLLIAGAQIFDWYWLVLLFAGGFGFSAYRSRGKLRSPYQIAQSVDRQLGYKDALSTAFYFSAHPERSASPDFVEHQRGAAEDLARSADLKRGVPFLVPRSAYVNVALVAVALGMFGLRYGIRRSLDLRSPLVRVDFEDLFAKTPQVADRRGKMPGDADGRDRQGTDASQSSNNDLNQPNDASQLSETPDPNEASTSADGDAKADAKTSQELSPGTNPLDSGDKGDQSNPSDASNSSNGSDSKSGQQNGAKDAKDAKGANQSGNSANNASLGSKLRDALSNLLAKMKAPPKMGGGKPNDSSQSSSSRPQQGDKQDADAKSPSQEQADASANSQAQGEQQQGGTQQAQQGKSEGRSNNQPNSPDGKSGIGKQDGDKAAREAAELAAMGKISEIIGKRAQNISGEVMVEVSPGKQQLKTQYSQQNATHSDAGGEINRDEVPLIYQEYVEQYFAQIRKLPAAKTKAAPAAPADSKSKAASSSIP